MLHAKLYFCQLQADCCQILRSNFWSVATACIWSIRWSSARFNNYGQQKELSVFLFVFFETHCMSDMSICTKWASLYLGVLDKRIRVPEAWFCYISFKKLTHIHPVYLCTIMSAPRPWAVVHNLANIHCLENVSQNHCEDHVWIRYQD